MEYLTSDTAAIVGGSVLVVWIVCGLLAYGWTLAYFQSEYHVEPERFLRSDRRIAAVLALGGPVSVLFFLLLVGKPKKGWRL